MSSVVEARAPNGCSSPVTVSPGDTLSAIARRCGTTLSALAHANPQLHDPDLLPVGSALVLPQGSQEDQVSQTGSVAEADIIAVEPSVLTPGGRVTITASNLPPGVRVWIKGGTSRSPEHHLILEGARVDAQGELHASLRLSGWLRAGDENFTLSVEVPRASITLSSGPLEVNARYAAGKAR
ncbi:LysM peptidoglycan-binding domain-containing protein [Microvirga makkahensis]|uniref:LysM peptidoglycan-binding domain-containing protein n=1 Tax=Microvirga makkahensis TaxID=1128670 RepID=A0A7X3MR76_9HYPH|nr:LysM domain-containing protein [Microvirga makkahensis]MXQ11754.1 LysM peptidoglycan-binding domain-containing protein [Microvirga makkahensis]